MLALMFSVVHAARSMRPGGSIGAVFPFAVCSALCVAVRACFARENPIITMVRKEKENEW